jgi:hypothetical protein
MWLSSQAPALLAVHCGAAAHHAHAYVMLCCGVTAAVGRVVVELFRYKKGSTLEEHAPLVSCWGKLLSRATCSFAAAATQVCLCALPRTCYPEVHLASSARTCLWQPLAAIAFKKPFPHAAPALHSHTCALTSCMCATLSCLTPQAVSNFLALCKGVEVGGVQLGYAGCPFTRIMSRFMLQAGDVVHRDGSGGGGMAGVAGVGKVWWVRWLGVHAAASHIMCAFVCVCTISSSLQVWSDTMCHDCIACMVCLHVVTASAADGTYTALLPCCHAAPPPCQVVLTPTPAMLTTSLMRACRTGTTGEGGGCRWGGRRMSLL